MEIKIRVMWHDNNMLFFYLNIMYAKPFDYLCGIEKENDGRTLQQLLFYQWCIMKSSLIIVKL